MEFIESVENFIREQQLINEGDHIVVGVSGGADSMCLLHVLDQLKERFFLTLTVVHINHGIRGTVADKEEEFVRLECLRRGLGYRAVHAAVPELAACRGISEEEAGREVRYQAFQTAAEELGCQKIAVAHHANDNAETFLFHAFRGSGLRGLKGMTPQREEIIRPLLCMRREEIEKYLEEEGIRYCTDLSNLTMDYARNRIRNAILPLAVQEINAGAVWHLAEAAGELAEVYAYIEAQTREAYRQVVVDYTKMSKDKQSSEEFNRKLLFTKGESLMPGEGELCLSVPAARVLPEVLQAGVLRMALEELAGSSRDFSRVHVRMCMELMGGQTGRRISLPYGIQAYRSYDYLCFDRRPSGRKAQAEELLQPVEEALYQEITVYPAVLETAGYELILSLQPYVKNKSIPKNCYTKWFDYDKINETLVWRTRHSGDYIVIHEDGRKKSLKSFFVDQKIPVGYRDRLPVLAAGSRVLWLPGFRSEEGLYVNENTKCILVAELKKKG